MSRIRKYIKTIGIYICILTMILSSLPIEVNAEKKVEQKKDDYKIVVSLGDSFSSGEGIEPFYGQNLPLNFMVRNEDWLAHRSTLSWPGRLKIPNTSRMEDTLSHYFLDTRQGNWGTDKYWYFEAISGATTNDIAKSLDEDKKSDEKGVGRKIQYNKKPFKDTVYLPYQIDVFDELEKEGKKADYVTMTLGGNDAEFADVIFKAAIDPGSPNILRDTLRTIINRADVICAKLEKTYELIAEKAGPQAKIIVAGYPKLLDPKGSKVLFNEEAAKEVNDAVVFFNKKIKRTVNACARKGMNIHFVSVEAGFENHGAYAEKPYINKLDLGPFLPVGDWNDTGFYSTYSMHPNSEGARIYAECVQRKINELEGEKAVTLSKDFQLIVFDAEQERCSDYKVSVVGTENVALWGLVKNDYYEVFDVKDDELAMSLPEGTYTITARVGDEFYNKEVKIRESSKEKQLVFYTDYLEKLDSLEDFFETDEIPEDDETEDVVETPKRQTSDERDIVLVLDVSGSMNGTPIDETKRAATSFVNTILKEDASIGCVTYENYATVQSDFSVSASVLNDIVNNLWTGGGTNIEDGLLKAEELLDYSNAKKKMIVLMSDGEPNDGKVGEELIAYADTLKDKGIYIYTLGFFEALGGGKSSAQSLMEAIASEGCHYEVSNAEELVFFFDDIADQINGQKYIYVRIACPVDVTVSYGGETLCSVEEDLNTRTDFGTLTFEENVEKSEDGSDNRIKILRLKDDTDYDIQIEGNGNGFMNYTIGFMDEDGEYTDLRKFNHIKIHRRTVIDTVATAESDTVLNVDEDGDGKYDLKYKAESNGRGKLVDYTYLIYVGIGTAASVALLISIFVIKNKIVKKRGKL